MTEADKKLNESEDKKGKQDSSLFIKRLQYPPIVNEHYYDNYCDSDMELGDNNIYFIL